MKKEYAELLKHPLWQKKRLEVMQRDGFMCKLCYDDETTIHVHHTSYKKDLAPWEYSDTELVCLCKDCHYEITRLMKEEDVLFEQISIFKSNSWHDGHRIMFISFQGVCHMRIYDSNSIFIIGFQFAGDSTLKKVSEMFDKAYCNG